MSEDITAKQIGPGWFIDLDWYQKSHRSFLAMAQSCLCAKCRDKLKGDAPAAELVATIKDCCSRTPGFISRELPVLESIFRLLLANGNQPLDLEELGRQLSEWRGNTYRTSPQVLSRLLKSDHYYGLRPAKA